MTKIKLTVQSIINLNKWEEVCEQKGWSSWILNEGQIDYDELVEFDDEFPEKQKSYEYTVHCGNTVFDILSTNQLYTDDIFTVDGKIYKIKEAGNVTLSVGQIHAYKVERIDDNE